MTQWKECKAGQQPEDLGMEFRQVPGKRYSLSEEVLLRSGNGSMYFGQRRRETAFDGPRRIEKYTWQCNCPGAITHWCLVPE